MFLKLYVVIIPFLVCFLSTISITVNAQSINDIASEYIIPINKTADLDAFAMTLPSKHSLADHETNARLIILLTNLDIKRLDDGSETKVANGKAFFLENTFSKGFSNESQAPLSYLVLQPNKTLVNGVLPACEYLFEPIIDNEKVRVCKQNDSGINLSDIEIENLVMMHDTTQNNNELLNIVNIIYLDRVLYKWYFKTKA